MKVYEHYYLAKRNLLPGAEERKRIVGQIKKGSRVHVSAVCGKAMASIACLLKEYGCIVTGSDSKFSPPMSDVLEAHGIKKLEPSTKNLRNIDLLVAGNTLAFNSLEVVEARKLGVPTISGAEAVAQIFDNKKSLVVAGTHGKTTTSALLSHIFIKNKENPAYLIGGVFQGTDDSYNLGTNSKYAIYEGDEYNCAFFDQAPKFLRYNPHSAIITSIEHDHVDLYPTFEDYKAAFQYLIEDLPESGTLIIHESVIAHLNLKTCNAKIYVYGNNENSDIRYSIKNINSEGTTFSFINKKNGEIDDIFLPMFGEYNIENAIAAFSLSLTYGLNIEGIKSALSSFPGTKERQELLGTTKKGVEVIRDYAHHPTAVSLTLEGLRFKYPNRKLIVIFEAKSASSKRKIFQDRYPIALSKADAGIVVCPKSQGEEYLDSEKIIKDTENIGLKFIRTENNIQALEAITSMCGINDVVIFMSSGDMDDIDHKFLEK